MFQQLGTEGRNKTIYTELKVTDVHLYFLIYFTDVFKISLKKLYILFQQEYK